jgi:hypothetical protein
MDFIVNGYVLHIFKNGSQITAGLHYSNQDKYFLRGYGHSIDEALMELETLASSHTK